MTSKALFNSSESPGNYTTSTLESSMSALSPGLIVDFGVYNSVLVFVIDSL